MKCLDSELVADLNDYSQYYLIGSIKSRSRPIIIKLSLEYKIIYIYDEPFVKQVINLSSIARLQPMQTVPIGKEGEK